MSPGGGNAACARRSSHRIGRAGVRQTSAHPSDGVAPQVLEALHRCGAQVLDLTCPFVDKLHRIVEAESGPECPVILLGEKEHPEVQGTAGWARGPVYVLSQEDELDMLPPMDQALVVAQTTFPPARWKQ